MVAALEQHQAKARAAGTIVDDANEKARLEGEGVVLCELQELAERMACMAVDAQKDHPIGFRRYSNIGSPFRTQQNAGVHSA